MLVTAKPVFNSNKDYIAIRHYKMASNSDLKFGDEVDVPSRRILFSLYRRNIIGEKGHAWTEAKMRRFCQKYKLDIADYLAPVVEEKEVKKVAKKTTKRKVKNARSR